MKILKKLFSKVALVFLAIVLQILPIIFFLYYFADLWWQLQLAFQILAILLAIVIINKKENPEFKAPWLIIILLFPIFGVIIYLLFANHYTRPRDIKLTRKVHKGIKEALSQQVSNNQLMEDFSTIGNYIDNLLPYRGTTNNNVVFFQTDNHSLMIYLSSSKRLKDSFSWNISLLEKVLSGIESMTF